MNLEMEDHIEYLQMKVELHDIRRDLSISDLVSMGLPRLSHNCVAQVAAVLRRSGVAELEDLLLLKEEDISAVLPPIPSRKLLNFFNTICNGAIPLNTKICEPNFASPSVTRGHCPTKCPTAADSCQYWSTIARAVCDAEGTPGPSLQVRYPDGRWYDAALLPQQGNFSGNKITHSTRVKPKDRVEQDGEPGNETRETIMATESPIKIVGIESLSVPSLPSESPISDSEIIKSPQRPTKRNPYKIKVTDLLESSQDSAMPEQMMGKEGNGRSDDKTQQKDSLTDAEDDSSFVQEPLEFRESDDSCANDDGPDNDMDSSEEDNFNSARSPLKRKRDSTTLLIPIKKFRVKSENTLINQEENGTLSCEKQDTRLETKYKGNFCCFCSKHFSKIARHLLIVHAKEPEIVTATSLPIKDKERVKILNKLRNLGNFAHNSRVLAGGKGSLMPTRRLTGKSAPSDLIPCGHCKGMFLKNVLNHHERRCFLKDDTQNTTENADSSSGNNITHSSHVNPAVHNYKEQEGEPVDENHGSILARDSPIRILGLENNNDVDNEPLLQCSEVAPTPEIMMGRELNGQCDDSTQLEEYVGSDDSCINDYGPGNDNEIDSSEDDSCEPAEFPLKRQRGSPRILAPIKKLNVKYEISHIDPKDNMSLPSFRTRDTQREFKSKGNYCYFCSKLVSKISRHMIMMHAKDPEVATAVKLPIKDKERVKILHKLRNLGNFAHNSRVLAEGKGSLMPARRLSGKSLPSDLVPCVHCKGMFLKSLLSLHRRRCFLKPDTQFTTETDNDSEKEKGSITSCMKFEADNLSGHDNEQATIDNSSTQPSDSPDTIAPKNSLITAPRITMRRQMQKKRKLNTIQNVEKNAKPPIKQKQPRIRSLKKSVARRKTAVVGQDDGSNFTKTTGKIRSSKTKGNCCYFCSKLCSKIARHLIVMHATEPDVVAAASFPIKNNERVKILNKLRNLGNFAHNSRVLAEGKGSLIPTRKLIGGSLPSDLTPCIHCKGFYLKSVIFLHQRRCSLNTEDDPTIKKRKIIVRSQLILQNGDSQTEFEKTILNDMLPDHVTSAIIRDKLIMKYGSYMYTKNPKSLLVDQRQKLRKLGKMLIIIQDRTNRNLTLSDALQPDYFDMVLDAVKEVACYCVENNRAWDKHIARGMRLFLKICTELMIEDAIAAGDEDTRVSAAGFLDLLTNYWFNSMRKPIWKNQMNPTMVCFTSEIIKFSELLDGEMKRCVALLQDGNFDAYFDLSNCLLVSMVLYNMERLEVVQYLTLDAVSEALHKNDTESVEDMSMSLLGKTVLKAKLRCKMSVKHEANVVILLLELHVDCIKLLMECRDKSGIKDDIRYLFTRFPRLPHFRQDATKQMLFYADKWNIPFPHLFMSAKKRRQICNIMQLCHLTEAELTRLTDVINGRTSASVYLNSVLSDTAFMTRVYLVIIGLEDDLEVKVTDAALRDFFIQDRVDDLEKGMAPRVKRRYTKPSRRSRGRTTVNSTGHPAAGDVPSSSDHSVNASLSVGTKAASDSSSYDSQNNQILVRFGNSKPESLLMSSIPSSSSDAHYHKAILSASKHGVTIDTSRAEYTIPSSISRDNRMTDMFVRQPSSNLSSGQLIGDVSSRLFKTDVETRPATVLSDIASRELPTNYILDGSQTSNTVELVGMDMRPPHSYSMSQSICHSTKSQENRTGISGLNGIDHHMTMSSASLGEGYMYHELQRSWGHNNAQHMSTLSSIGGLSSGHAPYIDPRDVFLPNTHVVGSKHAGHLQSSTSQRYNIDSNYVGNIDASRPPNA